MVSCAASPGRLMEATLAVGSAHHMRLLDVRAGERAAILPGDTGVVDALAWAPDGSALAAGDEDGGVYVWNVATRTLRSTLRSSGPPVFAAAWSPDGKKLALGDGSGHVTIWDTATGAQLSAWLGDARGRFHESSRPLAVYGVGWSPGRLMARVSSLHAMTACSSSETRIQGAIWPRCRRAISPMRSPGLPMGVSWRRATTMAPLKSGTPLR
jgi:WD40 repeat protein